MKSTHMSSSIGGLRDVFGERGKEETNHKEYIRTVVRAFPFCNAMDRLVKDDDRGRFSGSSSTSNQRQQQGLDFSAPDVLFGYDFRASTQPRRRNLSVGHGSSRHHHSSGSPVYLAGELFSARKDAEMDSCNSKIVSAVERTIKKYADNILRVLEGMDGRLSQLESVSQVLEHSVASLKASVDDYHDEADTGLKVLHNHVEEMHRAVQILRHKQDIVETNAELAKLQASKAEAVGEKASAFVPATKLSLASSEIVTQEQLALDVVSNLVSKSSSSEPHVSSQQPISLSGQLQQLSLSADVHTLPQQLVTAQVRAVQQSHALSQSKSCPPLQPQETIQSMPGVHQAQAQHVQTQHGLHQAQTQQVQVQQSVQSQQGAFQAQPQHVQTQHVGQLQQGIFQAQQQPTLIQQSAQSQVLTIQAHQQHVQTQQTSFQQGAVQTRAQYLQQQQGIEAPQGALQAHPQHLQFQVTAQSQQGASQAQQHYVPLTQKNVQSQQGAIHTQLHTQQSIQHLQGPQAQHFRGPAQEAQPPPSQIPNQTAVIARQSEQVQFQVAPQHSNIHQPLLQQPDMGQPSIQVPHPQYGSMMQTLLAQSIAQLPQFQPVSNSQLQTRNNFPSQSMVGHLIVQPPQTPNAHLLVQGELAGQGLLPFTQQIETLSHTPLPQATVMEAPAPSQVEYGSGPQYNLSNTGTSQQHSLSTQPILQAQDGNAYERFPSPLHSPQPVYAAQRARPVTPLVASAHALPVAQNVYNQSLAGGPPNQLSHHGIVDKVAVMGFSRDEARSAIKRLTDEGRIVDMNAVLDLLMKGGNQSQRGWQAR